MELVKKNWRDWSAVVCAWRVARWANHAWGQIPMDNLIEVWNVSPSLAGFTEILPGYAVAKGWLVEGPVGWGILAPESHFDENAGHWLRVWIGSHAQLRVDCFPEKTVVLYHHGGRWAEAVAEDDGVIVTAEGFHATPRDWARIARILVVAYGLSHNSAESVVESLRVMAGEEGEEEFFRYAAMEGPEIFASPAVFAGVG